MYSSQDRLTLDALLSDPLTQLVMRSDNLTPQDVAQAFDEARAWMLRRRGTTYGACLARAGADKACGERWGGR